MLEKNYTLNGDWKVQLGDAMTTQWETPIAAVVCETYLGQPFSAPPSPKKLEEVRKNCDYIVSTFLRNLSKQIKSPLEQVKLQTLFHEQLKKTFER